MSHTILPLLTLPDVPQWDWNVVARHWVPSDPFQPTEQTVEYYRVKHAIAVYTQAQSICEIGVRAGYSAAAFLSAGYATRYVGLDIDRGTDGGITGYTAFAEQVFRTYTATSKLLRIDSQQQTELPEGPYDLVHVDGDHSWAGAFHDTSMALRSGAKFVLIDDVDMMPDVSRAVMDVLAISPEHQGWYVYDGQYRGNVLIATR